MSGPRRLAADRRRQAPMAGVLLFMAAVFCFQLAWIITMPPFRGIDEFDHAYRAAAVANGQWVAPSMPAEDGRGTYVRVPRELVEAAEPVCSSLRYTLPENCNPVDDLGGGLVTVASAASTYNPLYYWLIGKPSSSFDGDAFVYALRVVSALYCVLLLGAAFWTLTRAGTGSWPRMGLALALSPCFVYSTTIGAPNGIEMCAGLAAFACLISLKDPLRPSHQATVLVLLGACVSLLVSVRLLGPLWAAIVVALGVSVLGLQRCLAVVRTNPRSTVAMVLLAAVGSAWALWWTFTQHAGLPSSDKADTPLPDPLLNSIAQVPVWFLQTIAMGPTRGEPAPTIVYGLAVALYVTMLLFAARALDRRRAGLLGLYAAVLLVVQIGLSAQTWPDYGSVWQGRYALPVVVAIPLLLGFYAGRSPRARLPVGVTVTMLTTAVTLQAVEVFRIAHQEGAKRSLYGDSWSAPAMPLQLGLVAVGLGLLVLAVVVVPSPSARTSPSATDPGSTR